MSSALDAVGSRRILYNKTRNWTDRRRPTTNRSDIRVTRSHPGPGCQFDLGDALNTQISDNVYNYEMLVRSICRHETWPSNVHSVVDWLGATVATCNPTWIASDCSLDNDVSRVRRGPQAQLITRIEASRLWTPGSFSIRHRPWADPAPGGYDDHRRGRRS